MTDANISMKLAERLKIESTERDGGLYKIDLLLGHGFNTTTPSAGMVSFWASGRALHGDGDVKLYVCPGKHLGRSNCEAMIKGMAQGHASAVCVACGTVWKAEELIGEVCYRLIPQRWAQVLAKWVRALDLDTDIRIIYPPDDIRTSAALEQARDRGGELLERDRGRRATRSYPARNILKDLNSGADLEGRILSFIRS
jgi:hypothetical protein